VFAIDTKTTKVVGRIPVGHRPRSIGFLPDGSRAYVSLENDGAIAVIERRAQVPAADSARRQGEHAQVAALRDRGASDGSTVFVTTDPFGHLFLVDPARTPRHVVRGRSAAVGVGAAAEARRAYTANGP